MIYISAAKQILVQAVVQAVPTPRWSLCSPPSDSPGRHPDGSPDWRPGWGHRGGTSNCTGGSTANGTSNPPPLVWSLATEKRGRGPSLPPNPSLPRGGKIERSTCSGFRLNRNRLSTLLFPALISAFPLQKSIRKGPFDVIYRAYRVSEMSLPLEMSQGEGHAPSPCLWPRRQKIYDSANPL